MKKKHQSPSKIRYNQSHPTVSVRVPRSLYDQLEELRETTGKTLGDIFREAVGKQAPATGEAYKRGYRKAQEIFTVAYRCTVCSGIIVVKTKEEKQAIARHMREQGWRHSDCIDR